MECYIDTEKIINIYKSSSKKRFDEFIRELSNDKDVECYANIVIKNGKVTKDRTGILK